MTPVDKCTPLADLIYHPTGGNPLFVVEFLGMLQDEKLVHVDPTNGGDWSWREDGIASLTTDDIVQLLVKKMERLPEPVQEVLKAASCLGVEFEAKTLVLVVGTEMSLQEVQTALRTAEDCGLVALHSDSESGRWVHDRYQQAAYTLIPEADRAAFHLCIGRQLQRNLSDKHIFLATNQLILAAELIQDQEEKDDLAQLCLFAGEKANRYVAFSVAARYLEQGISFLGRRHWRDTYELSLNMFNTAAEVAYCNGNFERLDELVDEIFANARSFEDKLWAHSTRIYSLGSRLHSEQAIDEGLDVLAQLGERLPARAGPMRTIMELFKTERLLADQSDESIMALPPLMDKQKLAAMRILNLIAIYTFWTRPDLLPLVTMRMVRITIRYGLTEMGKCSVMVTPPKVLLRISC